jgi:hypothetical protein
MRFDVRPFEGALPVRFGMRREEVRRLLGPQGESVQLHGGTGSADLFPRAGCNVGYDPSGVVNEVVIHPGAEALAIGGHPVWADGVAADPYRVLLGLDPAPVECVGNWYFGRLGVSTTGYHDDDSPHRAVRVWPRGTRDEPLVEATPADTSKYQAG